MKACEQKFPVILILETLDRAPPLLVTSAKYSVIEMCAFTLMSDIATYWKVFEECGACALEFLARRDRTAQRPVRKNIYRLRATSITFQTVVAAVVFGPVFFMD